MNTEEEPKHIVIVTETGESLAQMLARDVVIAAARAIGKAVADEREACAKIAEERGARAVVDHPYNLTGQAYQAICNGIAAVIRARGGQ